AQEQAIRLQPGVAGREGALLALSERGFRLRIASVAVILRRLLIARARLLPSTRQRFDVPDELQGGPQLGVGGLRLSSPGEDRGEAPAGPGPELRGEVVPGVAKQ